jgi:hypothetical protein
MKSKFRVIIKLFGLAAIGMLGIASIIASNDGGSEHGDVPPPDTTAAAGLWYGTLTTSGLNDGINDGNEEIYSFEGITSTDGQFRFIIVDGLCIGTEFEGTFSMNGNTGSGDFTGYDGGSCFFNNNEDPISGTVEFTVDGNTLTGTYLSQDISATSSLSYDPQVETPLTLAELEGTWIVEGAGFEGGDFSEITIFAAGSFTGTATYGCNVEGQISIIDPDWSITSVSVTKSNCDAEHRNGTYTGLGVLFFDEESQSDLFGIIVSSSAMSDFGLFTPAP